MDRLSLASATSLANGHRILNGLGKSLAAGSFVQGPVDAAALSAGVYTLVVVTKDGQTVTRRFFK